MFVYVHYTGPYGVQWGYLFTKAMFSPSYIHRPIVHRHVYVPRKIASWFFVGFPSPAYSPQASMMLVSPPNSVPPIHHMLPKRSLQNKVMLDIYHVKLSSIKSITCFSSCTLRTASRTSSARPPGPQTVTTMAPICSFASLETSIGMFGRPGKM